MKGKIIKRVGIIIFNIQCEEGGQYVSITDAIDNANQAPKIPIKDAIIIFNSETYFSIDMCQPSIEGIKF